MTVITAINRLDAHDRYQELSKHGLNISACCQDLIDQRPYGDHPFYIFAHLRTHDNGIDKTLIWQPRLTKPKAQTNSMLFKAYPGTDLVKVIWMIPAREVWSQYEKGLVTANRTVADSIHDFQFNRKKLEEREEDDMDDQAIDRVYQEIAKEARYRKKEQEAIHRANNLKEQPKEFKMV